jgi:hypothetical protein
MAAATGAPPIHVTDAAWGAIEGGYDLQVHVNPDVIDRSIDDLGLAQEFLKHRLKGFVLKSHYVPTYERAKVVTKVSPGITAFGAITLNHSVGGLNPVAVEIAGRSGNKIVWMPTVDAANETGYSGGHPDGTGDNLRYWARIQRDLSAEGISPQPLTVLGDDGRLNEPARRCLERIAKHDMILATGHLGRKEIYQLVKTGKEMGVRRIMVTHAEFPSQNLSIHEQVELANLGATIEHCFITMHTNNAPWDVFFESVRQVGPGRVILSTDLGQTMNPPVAEGFAMFAQKMLDAGFSKADVRRMTVTNPTNLLS